MTHKKRVNETIVRQAIEALEAQGKKTSVRALLAHIGYGSMGTIAKYKNQIEGHHETSVAVNKQVDIFQVARLVLTEMLPVLEDRIQTHLQQVIPSLTPLPDYHSLEGHLRTTQEELRQKESELREMRQLYHSVLADRSEKTRAAIALKHRLAKAKQEAEEKDQKLNQLNALLGNHTDAKDWLTLTVSSMYEAESEIDYAALVAWNAVSAQRVILDRTDPEQAEARALYLWQTQPSISARELSQQLQQEGFQTMTAKRGLQAYSTQTIKKWLKQWQQAQISEK